MVAGFLVTWINTLMIEKVFPVLIKYLKEQAAKTETPIDDAVVEWLEGVLKGEFLKVLDEVL